MEIVETVQDGSAVVHLSGSVNSSNAPELAERLAGLIAGHTRSVVVDMSALEHMTSAGFRSLLRAHQTARAKGERFVLFGLHGLMQELFEIGGFIGMFTIAASRDEAMRLAAGPQ
jgi:stage II sporulation protein AA (anti-sigma F factor antagonist)